MTASARRASTMAQRASAAVPRSSMMVRVVSLVGWAALAACTAPPRGATPNAAGAPGLRASAQAAPPAPAAAPEASYDWHHLLPVPFGTGLHESGLKLREVLLFHDRAQGADADSPGEGDCFTLDSPPRFVGHEPYEYLLCFDHDHLARVDAAVRLDAGEADRVFARACALWLAGGAAIAGTPDRCEGSEEHIAFRARLENTREEGPSLAMTLLSVAGGAGPAAP